MLATSFGGLLTNKRRMITVASKSICEPLNQEGLGIRSVEEIVEIAFLRQTWNKEEEFAVGHVGL